MIRLTFYASEKPIWFNPEKIRCAYIFADIEGGTSIVTTDGCTTVEESPEEVARKVLEWRLAMIDYHHDIPSVKTKAMAELVRLAGLEEPNHD